MDKEAIQKKPIRRHQVLQPISREHHHTLLLVWKIRKGLATGIDPKRIKRYTDWFYKTYAAPHFELEEKFLFPVLEPTHELIIRALDEHQQLRRLFKYNSELNTTLTTLADLLESHVRFEERVLLNLIQEMATPHELEIIRQTHSDARFIENARDEFWN
ncbi:hemerythrin domain-containing protein [Flavihumibacter rivuli]|uniref:hemerythrin domain-containing protein n=1 Tax=Flavihumibacter rivuli TaxID=2838156 RepID=UPI001BDDF086|nr:hemerythrin domain-containing protein [Flavihumibacter rivuli]ULQ58319.1 hemerythrin domain-containing protein [Flavihumibacter rivuli]